MRTAGAALLLVLAAACGGGADDAPTDVPTPTATEAASPTGATATASLVLHEDSAARQAFDASDFAPAGDGEDLFVADRVRTDATGFAEISYLDGSLARLDVDTEVEVLELAGDADAPDVVLDMDVGRTWHHVTDHPDTRYVVETNVATATVRGTTFLVTCPDATTCTFLVFEGTVELTAGDDLLATLAAGDAVTVVGADDPTAADEPGAFDAAVADEWVRRNAEMDDVALPEPTAAAEALAGGWTVEFLVTEATGRPIQDKAQGQTYTRAFDIVPRCEAGSCSLEITRTAATTTRTDVWTPSGDGYDLVVEEAYDDANCGGGSVAIRSTFRLTPAPDGTSFSVAVDETWTVSPAAASAGCTDSRVVSEGSATRAGSAS